MSRLNLDRSLRLLAKASGNTPKPYSDGSPYDHTISFQQSPRRSMRQSVLSTTLDADNTLMLLGTVQPNLSFDVDTTNVTQLMDEEALKFEGGEIFTQFSQVYQSCRQPDKVFDMLNQYKNVLSTQTEASKTLLKGSEVSKRKRWDLLSLHNSLRTEMWTWQLTESLLRDLVDSEIRLTQDIESMEDEIPAHIITDQQLMKKFFTENEKVRRSQIVIDWLETINSEDVLDNFSEKVDFYAAKRGAMWENTLHAKKNTTNLGKPLIDELDPDAPYRTGGKLSSLDVEDDERLIKHVYLLLRAGRCHEAQELCVRCGQAWRAATLEGWRLLHDPNYTKDNDGEDDVIGNPYRDVWKSACWSLVQEDMFSVYERAVYASLCGNLEHLLPVCESWSDVLWAYLKVLVDVELEEHIRLHSTSTDRQLQNLPASYWAKATSLKQIFKELDANHQESLKEPNQRFFQQIQKYLILNEFDEIVNVMVDKLKEEELSPHVLRFMAHFALFLNSMDKITIEGQTMEIIEEYIKYLISTKQLNLVAEFCAVLPSQNQIIIYSLFLQGIQDQNLRREALRYGKEAGLDMNSVTKVVVESFTEKLRNLVDLEEELDSTTLNATQHHHQQIVMMEEVIGSLDWLLFDNSQILDAITLGTAQMRIFLALKLDDRLKQVFIKLPLDKIRKLAGSMTEEQNIVKEYLCFKAYLEAKESFDDWFKHYHQAPRKPQSPNSNHFADSVAYEQKMKQYDKDHQRWQNALQAASALAVCKIKAVLMFSGGWMVDELSIDVNTDEVADSRSCQLLRIRQLCIPELVSLLYKILDVTDDYVQCIKIADLVASEDYQLYRVFSKGDLQSLLLNIQESSKKLLDQNKDSLGYPLS